MNYEDLPPKVKQSINGMIAQFMDAYIRQNKVWTPDQMLFDFLEKKNEEYHTYWFAEIEDTSRREAIETALGWILSIEGEQHLLERITKKYNKDKDIAIRESPIAERVRFGKYPKPVFDISYGLKGQSGHDRMTTNELRELKYTAWTIEHVEDTLFNKYSINLKKLYSDLPLNHYEIDFSTYWLDNYHPKTSNPALIPHINSLRASFYYTEYKGKVYKDWRDIKIKGVDLNEVKSIRFKYDFLIINTQSKKSCFIDLIPDDPSQIDKDLSKIKETQAKENSMSYITFTHSEIKASLKDCFVKLKPYLGI